jgi:hypothetical protein
MQLTMGRFGVARTTCVVVCLAFACSFAAAQEIVSVNDAGGAGAAILTRPTTDESVLHNVLPEVQATQTQGSGAVSTPDPESQGNFFKRLGNFYAADWTGKLPASAAPERRALDAPLQSHQAWYDSRRSANSRVGTAHRPLVFLKPSLPANPYASRQR